MRNGVLPDTPAEGGVQGSGRIVNIGSVVGFLSTPWNGTYSAAKAAVHMLTDALRVELRPFGLKVVLVAPGGIR